MIAFLAIKLALRDLLNAILRPKTYIILTKNYYELIIDYEKFNEDEKFARILKIRCLGFQDLKKGGVYDKKNN